MIVVRRREVTDRTGGIEVLHHLEEEGMRRGGMDDRRLCSSSRGSRGGGMIVTEIEDLRDRLHR